MAFSQDEASTPVKLEDGVGGIERKFANGSENCETKEEASNFDAIRGAAGAPPVPSQALKDGWEIPVIDLSRLRSSSTRRLAVEQIGKACQEWGFFHAVNHGVPEKVIDGMWKAYDALYKVPEHERAKFEDAPFVPPALLKMFSEKYKSKHKFGESRDTIRFSKLNPDDEAAVPNSPLEFRGPAIDFFRSLRDLGFELLEAISESLGLERAYLRRVTGSNPCVNSSIHRYLPCHDADKNLGLNAHQDIDTLTVLLQNDVPGLQVMKEDRWVDVRVLAESLVVNVGEFIQAITNHQYKSAWHRAVLDKENVRCSISCFLLPTPESVIEPLPHLVNEENPPSQPPCNWETYFYNHFAKGLKL